MKELQGELTLKLFRLDYPTVEKEDIKNIC